MGKKREAKNDARMSKAQRHKAAIQGLQGTARPASAGAQFSGGSVGTLKRRFN